MIDNSKVENVLDSKAFAKKTEAVNIEVEGVIEGVFKVAEMADHMPQTVADMIMSIATRMIPMRNMTLLRNGLYPYPYRP